MASVNASMAVDENPRDYICTVPGCGKAYRRNEHLERHLRSHKLQKPFDCPICHKNYGRKDVLKRHVASQHTSKNSHWPSRHQRRVLSACDRCHSRKAACSGKLPCQRCQRSNNLCQYPRNGPRSALAVGALPNIQNEPPISASPSSPSSHSPDSAQDQSLSDANMDVDTLLLAQQSGHTASKVTCAPLSNRSERNGSTMTLSSNGTLWKNVDQVDTQNFQEIQPEVMHMTYPLVSAPSPEQDYADEPFAPLPSLREEPVLQTADQREPWPRPPVTSHSSHRLPMPLSSTDDTRALGGDLSSLGHNEASIESIPRDVMPAHASAPSCHLDAQTLDYILESNFHGTALSLDSEEHFPAISSGIFNTANFFLSRPNKFGLPDPPHDETSTLEDMPIYNEPCDAPLRAKSLSLSLLGPVNRNYSIDLFFAKFHRLWGMVHRATFNSETEDQDLVDTITMVGAWESGIPSWMEAAIDLHKTITKDLREKLFDLSPKQDVGLRWPVSTYQTLLINAIFALQTSDDKLFTKAYMQHSITLSAFRDAGLFNEQYILAREDTQSAIPSSWLRRETLKRLAYLAFRLDIYFYFLRGYRPMLRYDELCLTLPCSERLWEAQTVEEWHEVKLIESKRRNPMHFTRLVDQVMDHESRVALPPLLEDEYLYGLCAMQAWLWQDSQRYRYQKESGQVRSTVKNQKPGNFSQSSDFWSKQLAIWIEDYRNRSLGPDLSSKNHRRMLENSAIPLYHLSQIILTANVETIKELSTDKRLLPGSGTFRRQLESSTLRWVQTSDARLAIWHAAKVLKLLKAKFSDPDMEDDSSSAASHIGLIAPIALYEAGLVVWAYARSVQVCDACAIGSSLQAASPGLDSFELFGTEQDELFREWLEHGGREMIDSRVVCACNLDGIIGLYEEVLLQCGSQWRCVSQMAHSLSLLKQGD